jgi:hypothetical protein
MKTIVLTSTQLATDVKLLPRFINRSIDGKHVAKLKKSIIKFGVLRDSVTVMAPFIGSNLYTLDGQHLHQACIELGKSVRSKVIEVSSEKELINLISDMNSTSKKWSIIDFVNSWSASGDENYIHILNCLNKYSINAPVLFLQVYNKGNRVSNKMLSDGTFKLNREYGDKLLSYYDTLNESGLNTSASSLKSWAELFKLYSQDLSPSTVKKLAHIIKKNIKVYSQNMNTLEYKTYLEAHLIECI